MEEACMNDDTEKTPAAVAATEPAPEKKTEETAPDPTDRMVKFAVGVGKELGVGLAAQATRKLSSTHVQLLCAGLNSAGLNSISHRIWRMRTYGQ